MTAYVTTVDVLAAIGAGHTTRAALAAHFGIPAKSYNLGADLKLLTESGTIAADGGTYTVATDPPAVDKDGIPIHHGPGLSDCCWVNPGQAHNLSCDAVSIEQCRAFLTR